MEQQTRVERTPRPRPLRWVGKLFVSSFFRGTHCTHHQVMIPQGITGYGDSQAPRTKQCRVQPIHTCCSVFLGGGGLETQLTAVSALPFRPHQHVNLQDPLANVVSLVLTVCFARGCCRVLLTPTLLWTSGSCRMLCNLFTRRCVCSKR